MKSNALYRGFVGGRGAGKSFVGGYDLLKRAKPGRLYMIAGPTFKLLKNTALVSFEKTAREMVRLVSVNRSDMRFVIRTVDGKTAEVICGSADKPDSLRGPNLSGIWIDEASFTSKDLFLISIASLREGGELGWMSCTFTPRGKVHWTYEIFGGERENTALFHCPTRDNPFNHEQFETLIAGQYTSHMQKQELGGEFIDEEGSIVSFESMMSCTDQDCLWKDNEMTGNLFVGADIGAGVGRDRTAIWIWEKVGDVGITRKVIANNNRRLYQTEEDLDSILRTRKVVACRVDEGSIGGQIKQSLERKYPGIVKGVTLSSIEQARLANTLAAGFDKRLVRIPDDSVIRQDFQLVSRPQTSAGRDVIKTERDETGHADRFWAAALGYDALMDTQTVSFRRPIVRR